MVTDSRLPGESKDPESTSLTKIYDAFATEQEKVLFREQLRDGLGWGEAKKRLVAQIEKEIGPMREKYAYFMAHPGDLEDILQAGAKKARKLATPFLERLREAVGLRQFHTIEEPQKSASVTKKKSAVAVKQYRGEDGKFYFKLTDASGRVLLTSIPFESGKEAGMIVGQMKKGRTQDLMTKVTLEQGVTEDDIRQALADFTA